MEQILETWLPQDMWVGGYQDPKILIGLDLFQRLTINHHSVSYMLAPISLTIEAIFTF